MSDIALRNHFSAMARNSAWSNYRLLSACEQLTDAEFAQERTSFFPSIQLTLNHNLIVDHMYMADMIGKGRKNIGLVGDIPYAKASDLKQAQTEFDSSLIGFCDDIEPEGPRQDRIDQLGHRRYVARADLPLAIAPFCASDPSPRAGPCHAGRHQCSAAAARRVLSQLRQTTTAG